MRFAWRSETDDLNSHHAWLGKLEPKNRQPGTSAPTLAGAWSGPLDLLGALATNHDLAGLTISSATVEEKAKFDAHGGNARNHDLVVRGTTPTDESVVVCIEAKAGETLGQTVAKQKIAAEQALSENPRSEASARLIDLVARFCRHPADDPRVAALRYQLLTAWAGTIVSAAGAQHAVLALHEFRTYERPDDKSSASADELGRFADAVLGCELPDARRIPWCVRVPDLVNVQAALYVAHVVTDLRPPAIAGSEG